MDKLIEVRFHGRGGQGAWTASQLLAQAGLAEGKQVQSFPSFGPERAGAPMAAFTRISDMPIQIHSNVYEPDVSVVLDPTLIGPAVVEGFKPDSVLVANSSEEPRAVRARVDLKTGAVWAVDATEIAVRFLGAPIANTAMLGGVVRASGVVKLESLLSVIGQRFTGKTLENNIAAVRAAHSEARKD